MKKILYKPENMVPKDKANTFFVWFDGRKVHRHKISPEDESHKGRNKNISEGEKEQRYL